DNNVLLQLVGKRLLTEYAEQFKDGDVAAIARVVAGQIGEGAHRFGLRQMGQSIADLGKVSRSVEGVRDPEAQRGLLTDRVETMVEQVAMSLREATKGVAPEDRAVANAAA